MSTIAIVGTQWGDEGKGKIVDILSEKADYIVRFQGGNNAGHTVVIDGTKYILHLLPSGILHDEKKCILGNGMVIDLEGLLNEIEFIKKIGMSVEERIFVSERAHLILPYHKELDAASEKLKGNGSIGTTLKGIGPAYRDKAGRIGIRIADLRDEETFKEKLKWNIREKELILKHVYNYDVSFDFDEVYSHTMRVYEKINPFVADTVSLLNQAIDTGKKVLFEGAQATLLDIDVGTYPYVTSSNSSALGVTTGTGISPKKIEKIYGIAKAYTTRVGGGPFPTELKNNVGELLRARGHEYGSTTGRPRRCGWLDLFALKFSKMVNDLDGLIITKLDVLDAFDEIKVCIGYELNGEIIDYFPSTAKELSEVKPVYETLPGWKSKTTHIKRFEDLPKETQNFLKFIEDYLEVEIPVVSTGPQRDETIPRHEIW
ncbi:Adenylosuccinate synthetase [Desulfurobacterium thermolithotrophum DSM 11699]|uniref:Adenylosuccinate synthetase n=1 Tax=Desulfurobacterium thermolithotrophum (strain DSM 11699 / BSA) TaxID=868864 RepID=F0S0F2_DESTD|nr:adenylosuccinate synthase [Desulfurobacterium thermolithotrophum]ADY72680.1 Adenylosuccinate synthetase [Desulfurobacterium thermolithotrophum DSM 11699]